MTICSYQFPHQLLEFAFLIIPKTWELVVQNKAEFCSMMIEPKGNPLQIISMKRLVIRQLVALSKTCKYFFENLQSYLI